MLQNRGQIKPREHTNNNFRQLINTDMDVYKYEARFHKNLRRPMTEDRLNLTNGASLNRKCMSLLQ